MINSRHAPLVWKSNPSSVYPRLSSPRTIISTPFGERRRFSLRRLVSQPRPFFSPPVSFFFFFFFRYCCFSCFRCSVLRVLATSKGCWTLLLQFPWRNAPCRHFFHHPSRCTTFIYNTHTHTRVDEEKLERGKKKKNSENNDRFFIRIVTQCVAKVNDDLKLDPDSFLPPYTSNISIFFFKRLGRFSFFFLIKQRDYRVNNYHNGRGKKKKLTKEF